MADFDFNSIIDAGGGNPFAMAGVDPGDEIKRKALLAQQAQAGGAWNAQASPQSTSFMGALGQGQNPFQSLSADQTKQLGQASGTLAKGLMNPTGPQPGAGGQQPHAAPNAPQNTNLQMGQAGMQAAAAMAKPPMQGMQMPGQGQQIPGSPFQMAQQNNYLDPVTGRPLRRSPSQVA